VRSSQWHSTSSSYPSLLLSIRRYTHYQGRTELVWVAYQSYGVVVAFSLYKVCVHIRSLLRNLIRSLQQQTNTRK